MTRERVQSFRNENLLRTRGGRARILGKGWCLFAQGWQTTAKVFRVFPHIAAADPACSDRKDPETVHHGTAVNCSIMEIWLASKNERLQTEGTGKIQVYMNELDSVASGIYSKPQR